MKQVLQSLSDGSTTVAEVPCPAPTAGSLLIRTSRTLVSAGTERMLVEFGKAGLLQKAKQQPDKVRDVLDKIKTDGLLPTLDAVRSKLDAPLPLGYCNAGVVLEVGAGVEGFSVGDRVASNGGHAEVVRVPANLCARIPGEVPDEAAAFTVISSIALQGIRLVQPTLGESIVVTGLGLIGLIAVQLLRAHGCRVLGVDPDPKRAALAREFGAETVLLSEGQDAVAAATAFSRGRGVDGVLITASTKSNEPVHQAARMCRKRGRIVLVGVTGLELSRADFYEKELTFQVSCSYGPGRYDPLYEEGGQDYPLGFVRWTEQWNFEAVLDMLAAASLDVGPLVTHRFAIENAADAYATLTDAEAAPLGIILEYPDAEAKPERTLRASTVRYSAAPSAPSKATVGVIGAGNYASRVLVPAFKKAGARLHSVASSAGVSGAYVARKYGFAESTTKTDALIASDAVDTIVIATRHNAHARQVCAALRAGKHVFCEKPLALTLAEVDDIEAAYRERAEAGDPKLLMVGFNRRFAPTVEKTKALLAGVSEPKALIMTVNAGAIPANHWTQDPAVGGGRIIGEGCHFIDLLRFLVGAPVVGFDATPLGSPPADGVTDDKASVTLRFGDGSHGTVHYLANGSKAFPKERLEVFCAGRVLQLDNYRKLRGFGWPGFRGMGGMGQDKGQDACAARFVEAVRSGGPSPIPVEELLEVSRVTIRVGEALRA